jgi:hypothetical protein
VTPPRPALGLSAAVFAVATALYLPTASYGFVQDDRAIIALNPVVHSLGAALEAFDQPYWPPPAEAGLYRPVTIFTFALDWVATHGSAAWMHVENAVWHGLVSLLVVLVLLRWLPLAGAAAAGLVFAVHPVHVEGVANIVSRNELLATAGMLAAVLAARRRHWIVSLACLLLAMLSKERGIVGGALIVLDDWLRPVEETRYPLAFYGGITGLTVCYFALWLHVGHSAVADVAAPFIGAGTLGRIAMALPALLRAATLLVWPADLSVDYGPQVIPFRAGLSLAAVAGAGVVCAIVILGITARRRAPALSFAACATAIAALPTSNLLFPSGIVLSERDLYLPVVLPAVLFGTAVVWAMSRWPRPRVVIAAALIIAILGARSLVRLPAWTDNRTFLLTLVNEHPESYRGQQAAGAVLAGIGDTASARVAYARAESLFSGDPHFNAGYALFLIEHGDSAAAAPLVRRARQVLPRERIAMRVEFLLARERGAAGVAAALADTALRWFPGERGWYGAKAGTTP